ncbi:MAG: hypothetical protein WDA47_07385 [Bacilli bacterium]|jgi:hypothetical protein
MCVKGYIGYSIIDIRGIKEPYSVLLFGAAGVALTTEDHFLDSIDTILSQAKEDDVYKHFIDMPLLES